METPQAGTPLDSDLFVSAHASCISTEIQKQDDSERKIFRKKWVKAKDFIGRPKKTDFLLVQDTIRNILDGEIMVKGLLWTLDNYTSTLYVPVNSIIEGEMIGSVIATKHPGFPLFALVACMAGWTTLEVIDPSVTPARLLSNAPIPISLFLGTAGLPGMLAYVCVTRICKVEANEVVAVNAAAGSVGNVAGQLAKSLKNCTVIGFSGSKERCDWLRELDFDFVFNYNHVKVCSALRRVAPEGVDVYIDTAGCGFTEDVLSNMKPNGRICMCGHNNNYNYHTPKPDQTDPYHVILQKQKQIRSFTLQDFSSSLEEIEAHIIEMLIQGYLLYRETRYKGFVLLPEALIELYDGTKVGKVIVCSDIAASIFDGFQ